MRISRLPLIGLLACTIGPAGCQAEFGPPRAQWLVTVSTDAVVPQFGDRVLIEVVDDAGEACDACGRLIDASRADAWPISFGVVSTGDARRVRARLLRASTLAAGGQPAPGTTIDLIVRLTSASNEVSMRLAMDCYGVDASLTDDTTCNPDTGAVGDSVDVDVKQAPLDVASWGPSQAVPCATEAPPRTVCVEGGAFLLGDAAAVPFGDDEVNPAIERVVSLAPFYLDQHEFTVGEYLELRSQFPLLGEPDVQGARGTLQEFCQYRGPDDSSTAAYPINCIPRQLAEGICEKREMLLPTEAQWEFAAGNGSLETPYPWGDDPAICDYAVIARAKQFPGECRNSDAGILPPGPQPSDGKDTTISGIVDLGGNVEEWTADTFAEYGTKCWSELRLEDPLCTGSGRLTVRGGHWSDIPFESGVVRRAPSGLLDVAAWRGFRCAKRAL